MLRSLQASMQRLLREQASNSVQKCSVNLDQQSVAEANADFALACWWTSTTVYGVCLAMAGSHA